MKSFASWALLLVGVSAVATPQLERRDGLPSCSSQPQTPAPANTRCGTQGTIDKTKASQNLISLIRKIPTANACADQCRKNSLCKTFSYIPKQCTLYKQTPAQNKFKSGGSNVAWYNSQCFTCACGANQIKQADDSCQCSTGTLYSSVSQSCVQCPNGAVLGSDGTTCTCQGNQQLSSDGSSCGCPAGSSVVDSTQPYSCVPDCPSGAVRGADGTSCTCQGNQVLSADGSSCGCAAGSSVIDSTQPYQCVQDCPSGASRTAPSTTCVCSADGTTLSADGTSCVSSCPSDATYTGGQCVCNAQDYTYDGTSCVYSPTCTVPNQVFDGTSCKCSSGYLSADGTQCQCPSGSLTYNYPFSCHCIMGVLNRNGTACVDPCAVDDPNKFTVYGGACVCRPTFFEDANGMCNCPSGTVQQQSSPYGDQCTCPNGQILNRDGVCKCPSNAQPGTCECGQNAGLEGDYSTCSCPNGFIRSPNGYDCQCPSGQTQCGNSCADLTSDPSNCGTCYNLCPLVNDPNRPGHGLWYQCRNSQCVYPS